MNRALANPRRPRAGQVLLLLASLVVVIAGLKAAQGFFVPMLLAFFIATVSFPITNWLRNHRVPRAVAVLLTVLVDFAFIAGVVLLAIAVIGDLQEKWHTEYYNLTKERVQEAAAGISSKLDSWGVEDAGAQLNETVDQNLARLRDVDFMQVWSFGTDVVGRVVSFLGTSLVVIILTIFMLTEARMFGRRMDAVCEARGPNIQRMVSALKDTQRYLGIKTVISLVTGVLAGTLCWAAGLDFYPLWGILAFALNYIPVVGSFIAGVAPTVLALLVKTPADAVVVMFGFFLINTFLGNFVEPMLMGRRFGLSTLVVLLSVMFWGWLWGPIGMLLAVPLTMMVKVILDNSEEFRWIAVAIGKESNRPTEESRILTEGASDPGEEEDVALEASQVDAVGR
ncbi:AI-2E family transporter [Haloferula rosea]|uniref:AI-2E family transporter n=1 Tax=Haloferula rosea TaxID=490093 RepID=A0A934RAL8_9BACT|nr:AI-2E family transporter [Haloferula rosea]MBK1827497.1 AI-2E family transporter [Haloferula rosea]